MQELEAAIDRELEEVLQEEMKFTQNHQQQQGSIPPVAATIHNYHILFASVLNHVSKVEKIGTTYEAIERDSEKLQLQIQSCQLLSDKLSKQIKRLDNMCTRANATLEYVDNIINLKHAKHDILLAINEANLTKAVSILKKVHSIKSLDEQPTEDYIAIQQAEQEVRLLVKKEFSNAIENSNVETVMHLCPLLQSLGLENEARDDFLQFMDRSVFNTISADTAPLDEGADLATAYAQALSNVFNTSYSIMQQYLPMVIEGMESSFGDIFFIRKLHNKCERESGIVLKRYMKYRQVRDTISAIKNETAVVNAPAVTSAEVHTILDELTMLIQYSCMYNKYIEQLCIGAESRKRSGQVTSLAVFNGPTDFHKMVDEMIHRYYLEGEKWLIQNALRGALLKRAEGEEGSKLDESFFILQRCAQRSLATHNIDASTSALNAMCGLLTANLLKQAQDLSSAAVNRICSVLQFNMNRHYRENDSGYIPETDIEQSTLNITKSLQALYGVNVNTENNDTKIAAASESFAIVFTCQRYIERLGKDIVDAGEQVFHNSATAAGDLEKLKLSREQFTAAKNAFNNVLYSAAEQIVASAQLRIKELISYSFGRQNPYGGIRFDVTDDAFEAQPGAEVQPQALLTALEILLDTCVIALPESIKDSAVALLADACCDKLERFICQTTFRFSGAIKMEECVRAVISLLNKFAGASIRSKFSRIKEIMSVITENSGAVLSSESFTHLTAAEVAAFSSLRLQNASNALNPE